MISRAKIYCVQSSLSTFGEFVEREKKLALDQYELSVRRSPMLITFEELLEFPLALFPLGFTKENLDYTAGARISVDTVQNKKKQLLLLLLLRLFCTLTQSFSKTTCFA